MSDMLYLHTTASPMLTKYTDTHTLLTLMYTNKIICLSLLRKQTHTSHANTHQQPGPLQAEICAATVPPVGQTNLIHPDEGISVSMGN